MPQQPAQPQPPPPQQQQPMQNQPMQQQPGGFQQMYQQNVGPGPQQQQWQNYNQVNQQSQPYYQQMAPGMFGYWIHDYGHEKEEVFSGFWGNLCLSG